MAVPSRSSRQRCNMCDFVETELDYVEMCIAHKVCRTSADVNDKGNPSATYLGGKVTEFGKPTTRGVTRPMLVLYNIQQLRQSATLRNLIIASGGKLGAMKRFFAAQTLQNKGLQISSVADFLSFWNDMVSAILYNSILKPGKKKGGEQTDSWGASTSRLVGSNQSVANRIDRGEAATLYHLMNNGRVTAIDYGIFFGLMTILFPTLFFPSESGSKPFNDDLIEPLDECLTRLNLPAGSQALASTHQIGSGASTISRAASQRRAVFNLHSGMSSARGLRPTASSERGGSPESTPIHPTDVAVQYACLYFSFFFYFFNAKDAVTTNEIVAIIRTYKDLAKLIAPPHTVDGLADVLEAEAREIGIACAVNDGSIPYQHFTQYLGKINTNLGTFLQCGLYRLLRVKMLADGQKRVKALKTERDKQLYLGQGDGTVQLLETGSSRASDAGD